MKTGICDAMNAMRLIAAATASSNSAAAIGSQRRSRGKLFPRSRVATGKTVKASKHSHGLFQPERAVRSNDPVDRPGRKHQAARQRSTHPGARLVQRWGANLASHARSNSLPRRVA